MKGWSVGKQLRCARDADLKKGVRPFLITKNQTFMKEQREKKEMDKNT